MTATESRHSGRATSTLTEEAESAAAGPNPFGPEVPTEEGGVVAMAGWSMAALAIALTVLTMFVVTGVRRRRRRRTNAAAIAQHAVSDLVERSRAESRAMRRRLAKRVARQIEAAA